MRKTIIAILACCFVACSATPVSESGPAVNVDVSPEAGPEAGGVTTKNWWQCYPLTRESACVSKQCGTADDGCGGFYACDDLCFAGQVCDSLPGNSGLCCYPNQDACGVGGPNGGPQPCGTAPDGCGGTIACPNGCNEYQECSPDNQCVWPYYWR